MGLDVLAKMGVVITANNEEFDTALKKSQRQLKRWGKQTQKIGSDLSKYVSLPLTGLGTIAVSNAIKFEKLSTSMAVLTGSAEEGSRAFERLKNFSASTPFQLGDLAQANNTLIGFGLSSDDAFKSLQRLADISAVTGSDIQRTTIAFGQSAAAGRVMTQDLNQFVNNGIPIYKLLGDVTGKTAAQIRDMAQSGDLTFDILDAAFKQATESGGLFFEGTKKLSQTLGGQISTLKDNFALLTAEFGAVIGEGLEPFISGVTSLLQRLQGLNPETKKWVVGIAGVTAAIGPLITGVGFFASKILPQALNGVKALRTGFQFLGKTAIPSLQGAFTKLYAVILANPVTAIIAGVTALTAAVAVYVSRLDSARAAQKTLNEVNNTALKNTAAEKVAVETLLRVARDENRTKEQRQKAISELNNLSPEYLGNLSLETINTQEATNATERYIDSLVKKAKTLAAQEKLVEIEKQLIDAEIKLDDVMKGNLTTFEKATTAFGLFNGQIGAALNPLTSAQGEISELTAQKDALVGFLNESTQGMDDLADATDGANKKFQSFGDDTIDRIDAPEFAPTISTPTSIEGNNLTPTINENWVDPLNLGAISFQETMDNLIQKTQEFEGAFISSFQSAEATQGNLLNDMVSNVYGAVRAVIKAYIAEMVAGTVAKTAASYPAPLGLILASAAGAAAGTLFESVVPKFAEGGITTGPTLAMVGDNNSGKEAIIPLERFGEIFGTGNDGRVVVVGGELRTQGTEMVSTLNTTDQVRKNSN